MSRNPDSGEQAVAATGENGGDTEPGLPLFGSGGERELQHLRAVVGSLAHDLRTPLANVSMAVAALRPGLSAAEARQVVGQAAERPTASAGPDPAPILPEDMLNLIEHSVSRARWGLDLVIACLYERAERQDFECHSMTQCVYSALDDYPFQPGERERIGFDPGADFLFEGTRSSLIHVIQQLLKNALYATRNPQGEIRIWLECTAAMNRLNLRDRGHGIAADVLPGIFEHFYSTRPGAGAGLGLPFCRRIMGAFGGSIECRSEPGKYTQFVLNFPVVK